MGLKSGMYHVITKAKTAKAKAEPPRARIKYINARLAELKTERDRLIEERKSLLGSARVSGPAAGKGRPAAKAPSSDE